MLLLGLMAIPAAAKQARQQHNLKFQQDGSFKIIQVSDLQEVYLSGRITREFLYDLAKNERPDLFVLAGDNISSGGANLLIPALSRLAVKRSVDAFMDVFDRIYRDFGIPVTMVFGNHDNELLSVSRAEQFAFYEAHRSFIGWRSDADKGTFDVQGEHVGTHNLLIKDHAGIKPVFNLWLFDSGSNDPAGGYSCVQKPQIDWFNATNQSIGKLPSFSFQHIIVPEIFDYLTPDRKLPPGTVGELREDPCPGRVNEGQFEAMKAAGNVVAMFFGHDHVNTFELRLSGAPDLVNSPGGFGSYGDLDLRGVRVITLKENDLSSYKTYCVSYRDYYGGSFLGDLRLNMYQSLRTPATFIDTLVFWPLLRVIGWFS